MMTKALIDTNILVYAHHRQEKEKHEISFGIIKQLIDQENFVLSIQNLAEFSKVLSEKAFPSLDKDSVRQYVFDLSEVAKVIPYHSHTIMDALSISKQYNLHFFDALLVATMQENGIDTIITENEKDFKKIPWLNVKNPFRS